MRLFAKIFFCSVLVLSIALSLSGYLLMTSSYQNAIEREIDRAFDEYQYNKFSVQATLLTNRKGLQDSFLSGYDSQVALFTEDKSLIYSNLPSETPIGILDLVADNTVFHSIEQIGSKEYILVCGKFIQSGKSLYLLVASDISSIMLQKEEMIKSFGRIYFLALGISMILIFLLSTFLTHPIKKLTKASALIAGGHYDKRLAVSGGDEIAELSRSFNTMAEAVEEKIDELSEGARQKEDFVANFAHELKTPLTSVIGYADMIYQKNLSQDDVKKTAWYILDEGLRLEALSLKLMDLIVLNRQEFVLEEMSAYELLENISQSLSPLFSEKKIELQIETDISLPLDSKGEYQSEYQYDYISVDYDLFKTLMLNLIDNSIKAGSTKIKISGKRKDKRYSICVEDNGRGIPANELNRITEAFYMVDKSRSRKLHGAGLGLALALKIAEIHGTTLRITSMEQIGTSVELNLLCKEDENI